MSTGEVAGDLFCSSSSATRRCIPKLIPSGKLNLMNLPGHDLDGKHSIFYLNHINMTSYALYLFVSLLSYVVTIQPMGFQDIGYTTIRMGSYQLCWSTIAYLLLPQPLLKPLTLPYSSCPMMIQVTRPSSRHLHCHLQSTESILLNYCYSANDYHLKKKKIFTYLNMDEKFLKEDF